jgi:hypothetical protein
MGKISMFPKDFLVLLQHNFFFHSSNEQSYGLFKAEFEIGLNFLMLLSIVIHTVWAVDFKTIANNFVLLVSADAAQEKRKR